MLFIIELSGNISEPNAASLHDAFKEGISGSEYSQFSPEDEIIIIARGGKVTNAQKKEVAYAEIKIGQDEPKEKAEVIARIIKDKLLLLKGTPLYIKISS